MRDEIQKKRQCGCDSDPSLIELRPPTFAPDYADNKYGSVYDEFPKRAKSEFANRESRTANEDKFIILDPDNMTIKEIQDAYKVLDEALRKIAGS